MRVGLEGSAEEPTEELQYTLPLLCAERCVGFIDGRIILINEYVDGLSEMLFQQFAQEAEASGDVYDGGLLLHIFFVERLLILRYQGAFQEVAVAVEQAS